MAHEVTEKTEIGQGEAVLHHGLHGWARILKTWRIDVAIGTVSEPDLQESVFIRVQSALLPLRREREVVKHLFVLIRLRIEWIGLVQ